MVLEQDTEVPEQVLPEPTPMTVIGEQVRPTRTSTPWTTMPSRPRRSDAAGSLACHSSTNQYEERAHEGVARTLCTELQHWMSPVSQLSRRRTVGVATAKRGRARREKAAARQTL